MLGTLTMFIYPFPRSCFSLEPGLFVQSLLLAPPRGHGLCASVTVGLRFFPGMMGHFRGTVKNSWATWGKREWAADCESIVSFPNSQAVPVLCLSLRSVWFL